MKRQHPIINSQSGELVQSRPAGSRLSVFNRSQTSNQKDWFRVDNVLDGSDTTKIHIFDEIGYWGTTAENFVQVLNTVETPKIELHLNSPGGDMFDGIAIYNALVQHSAEVTVVVDSLAASAASFIAQAGDKVIMTRASTLMIHDALALCYGNAEDMTYTASLLSKFSDNIAGIYAYKAGGKQADWRGLMQAETWYSAQEAVDSGLADEVYGEADTKAEQAANNWDLSVFNFSGRKAAPAPTEQLAKVVNRVKEAPVSGSTNKPKAEAEGTNTPPEEEEQTVTPETPSTPETPAAPAPVVPETPGAPANSGAILFVNGVQVSDTAAVQAHITALETFRNETRTQGRKSFVESLGASNKLAAPALAKTEAFALRLSDEDYEEWKNTWDDVPSSSLFGMHSGGGASNSGTQTPEQLSADDEVEILKETVKQHQYAGMSSDNIKATNSYKKLIAADPTFTL